MFIISLLLLPVKNIGKLLNAAFPGVKIYNNSR